MCSRRRGRWSGGSRASCTCSRASRRRRDALSVKLLVTLGRVADHAAMTKMGSEANPRKVGSSHAIPSVFRRSSRTAYRTVSADSASEDAAVAAWRTLNLASPRERPLDVAEPPGELVEHVQHEGGLAREDVVERL